MDRKIDDKVREEIREGFIELSTEVMEQCSQSVKDELDRRASQDGLASENGVLQGCDLEGMQVDELQALLKRQTEVAKAVADQEQSAWKMLNMMCHLTKVISEQEQTIVTLQNERIGAERKTAEISVDLRTQYVEISKLKQRYDAAESQLSSVYETVENLQQDVKRKNNLLKIKDTTIEELKRKLEIETNKEVNKGSEKVRHDRDQRLAEIRSYLGKSKGAATPPSPIYRPATNNRLQALRAARDSRLHEIRGMLQKGRNGGTQYGAEDKSQDRSQDNTSVTSVSEESMSELSSVESVSDNEERTTRTFSSRQRTRAPVTP